MLKVEVKHSFSLVIKVTGEAAHGRSRDVFLAQHPKVMLTRNLWSEVKLVNGIRE